MKLVTLSQYIDDIEKVLSDSCDTACGENYEAVSNYNDFLKRKLHAGLFVPCVGGKPLSHPSKRVTLDWIDKETVRQEEEYKQQYEKAQQDVIFEGWEVKNDTEIINKNGDRLHFSGSCIFYDIHDGNDGYIGYYLPDNPTLANLASATIQNPVKLKQ